FDRIFFLRHSDTLVVVDSWRHFREKVRSIYSSHLCHLIIAHFFQKYVRLCGYWIFVVLRSLASTTAVVFEVLLPVMLADLFQVITMGVGYSFLIFKIQK
ncbi:hypothetical protein PMAYCL1PPCAC_22502, partial [Pristionchus mayeri]